MMLLNKKKKEKRENSQKGPKPLFFFMGSTHDRGGFSAQPRPPHPLPCFFSSSTSKPACRPPPSTHASPESQAWTTVVPRATRPPPPSPFLLNSTRTHTPLTTTGLASGRHPETESGQEPQAHLLCERRGRIRPISHVQGLKFKS